MGRKFEALRRKIRTEYLADGDSYRQADRIARATAGQVANRKRRKKGKK